MAYETLQRSRVELRRRTLALPTKTFHVNASKPKPFATTEKFEKMAYETLQGSRVEFRRRTLALPARKPSSRKCLKAQTLCNNRKVRKKWLMKLCKDRVSNFDGGLWHFLQENLPAANASKPKTLCNNRKVRKKWLMKLCKDRVSNFDAGLWHFLQDIILHGG